MEVFWSEVRRVGNLMENLILRFPLLDGSLGKGIPSLGTISSYVGWMMVVMGMDRRRSSSVLTWAV